MTGVDPSCLWVRAGLHLGQDGSLSQGHSERQTATHIEFLIHSFHWMNEWLNQNVHIKCNFLNRVHKCKSYSSRTLCSSHADLKKKRKRNVGTGVLQPDGSISDQWGALIPFTWCFQSHGVTTERSGLWDHRVVSEVICVSHDVTSATKIKQIHHIFFLHLFINHLTLLNVTLHIMSESPSFGFLIIAQHRVCDSVIRSPTWE